MPHQPRCDAANAAMDLSHCGRRRSTFIGGAARPTSLWMFTKAVDSAMHIYKVVFVNMCGV